MVPSSSYRYVAEATSASGAPLGDIPLAPDWSPATESVYFDGVRAGVLSALRTPRTASIHPVWHSERARPHVERIEVRLEDDGERFSRSLPFTFLGTAVESASGKLVSAGKLAAGERFDFRIYAFPEDSMGTSPPDGDELRIEVSGTALSVSDAPLRPLLDDAVRAGEAVWRDAQFPVLIPRTLLGECTTLARAAGELETGGVLVGRLHRDPLTQDLYVVATAQIAAQHTQADQSSLLFTAKTWSAVDAALALRARDEILCGWWHSHPEWCVKCPPERRRLCPMSTPFFSAADRNLHRATFPRAYSLALLLSWLGDAQPSYDLFGWQSGLIEARGFYVTG